MACQMPFRSGLPSAVRNTAAADARPSTGCRITCEIASVPATDTAAMRTPLIQFGIECLGWLLRPGALRRPVARAARAERIRDGAVALVTRVLEELVVRLPVQ